MKRSHAPWFALVLVACGAAPGGGPSAPTGSPARGTPGPGRGGSSGDVQSSAPTQSAGDPAFLKTLAATRGFRLGQPVSAVPTADGKTVLFLRAEARNPRQSLFSLDLTNGATTLLASPEAILAGPETLSREERALRERLRVSAGGFTAFELDGSEKNVLLSLSGRLFFLSRGTGVVTPLKTGPGPSFDPHLSPDGRFVAYVRDNDLRIAGLDGAPERSVTRGGTETVTHGVAEFIAQEELGRVRGFWWSPDSTHLLYEEVDNGKVERLTIADPAHPESPPDRPFYPRAGRANAAVRFGIVPLNGGATQWLSWDRTAYPYATTVRWTKGAPPTLYVLDRQQRHGLLLAADPASGSTRVLLEENDPAWLNIERTVPEWLPERAAFLWISERSGHGTLELHDGKGALRTVLSPLGLEVGALVHVDGPGGWAYVEGNEGKPGQTSLFRLSLAPKGDPKAEVLRTLPEGTVRTRFGEGHEVFVSIEASSKGMPQWQARAAADGRALALLPQVGEMPAEVRTVELIEVGPRHTRVALTRPTGVTPGERLPIIDAAYGGPGHLVAVPDAQRFLRSQWIADATHAVVVAIDGPGTPERGREWERPLAGHFGDVPLEGHIEALEALAARFPELDRDRIGIFGWSYGGYLSAYAALARPDIYKAAVAGAPVVDWRDYDTAYTERYLGLPEGESAKAYANASLLTMVGRPGSTAPVRPLLIVHGTADDNVFFFHSLKLVDALDRAGHPYEFLPLSGVTHQLVEPELSERVWSRVAAFLRENLAAPVRGR